MFAHQSTKAWTTLCNAVLYSQMNIYASWTFESEQTSALKTNLAYLASSVTVSARPSSKSGIGDFREIKKAISNTVKTEIKNLSLLGFRGADLLTACFGKAVSEFGKYEKVEKADGSIVTVAELLELTREEAFNAIISNIETDDYTKFYIGWINLFGFTETSHDDVRRITQIGLNIDINELINNNILIRKGNLESLANLSDRISHNSKLGEKENCCMIDIVHKMMYLFSKSELRKNLLLYIKKNANYVGSQPWLVLNSLAEVLPSGIIDHKLVLGLLVNRDNLIKESLKLKDSGDSDKKQLDIEFKDD